MKSKLNPIRKSGTRNIFCPYYEDCLDHAAKRHWQYWNCRECVHQLTHESLSDPVRTIHDPYPFYELPANMYQEVAYRFD